MKGRKKWVVLHHNNMILALYQGHIKENLINFRGGDIGKIATDLVTKGVEFSKSAQIETDGSWSAELRDPDGNIIYFNTFPGEREKYINSGTVID